jgi:acyl dehydratase
MRKDECDMPTVLPERRFHDFAVGDSLQSRARTVTEADIVAHTALTWDDYPLHTDEEYAKTTPIGTRTAHGPLIYTLSIGLVPTDWFGDATLNYIGVDGMRHVGRVFPGDTIEVRATVTATRLRPGGESGDIDIEYMTTNQRGERVLQMTVLLQVRV